MNIEELRNYCLSLPYATEDTAFGEDLLLIRIFNRIFACISLTNTEYFVLKCDAERAIELREHHSEIKPAWHWNKKYWIQISIEGDLSDADLRSYIRHSYSEVVKKLPCKTRLAYPEISKISL